MVGSSSRHSEPAPADASSSLRVPAPGELVRSASPIPGLSARPASGRSQSRRPFLAGDYESGAVRLPMDRLHAEATGTMNGIGLVHRKRRDRQQRRPCHRYLPVFLGQDKASARHPVSAADLPSTTAAKRRTRKLRFWITTRPRSCARFERAGWQEQRRSRHIS